jgi:hypothetical protein
LRDWKVAMDALTATSGNPIRTSAIQFRSGPTRFLGFSNHEKGAPKQEISKRSTVCSTFLRSGWSVVGSASLDKRGTSKKRPSLHLHKVPTKRNKVSPRTFQTVPVSYAVDETSLKIEWEKSQEALCCRIYILMFFVPWKVF